MQKEKQPQKPNSTMSLLIGGMFLLSIFFLIVGQNKPKEENFVQFPTLMKQIENGDVSRISYTENIKKITGTYKNSLKTGKGNYFESRGNLNSPVYQEILKKHDLVPDYQKDEEPSFLSSLLMNLLPTLLLIGLLIFFLRSKSGGPGGALSSMSDISKMIPENCKNIRFKDVAGCEEAKENVMQTVDFLKNPKKYFNAGARIPKGIILEGPPGTGKSLLAKATAGEAGVPFFSYSGSEFVEMFVGVGASRVRKIFEVARKHAPAIIFIDEIDAIGGKRGNGVGGGGNDEREGTLIELLNQLQGTQQDNDGLIVMAATNRVDMLDDALLRPGRFDRKIPVGIPDVKGREEILQVHMKNKKISEDVDIKLIARSTPGMTGADLESLVNEAIIFSVDDGRDSVIHKDFEMAKDKLQLGDELKSRLFSEKDKIVTAYHEIGHTLVGMNLKTADPLSKVSIIPRGRALGITFTAPKEDNPLSYSRQKLFEMICVLMGGRAAEELRFGEITTGASNDIERASHIAESMVCEWGMGEIGTVKIKKDPYSQQYLTSDETKRKIDQNIKDILDKAYETAKNILSDKFKEFDVLSQELLKVETLDYKQVQDIVKKIDDYKDPTANIITFEE